MTAIPAAWEVEVGRSRSEAGLSKSMRSYLKTYKKDWGFTQGPEFKLLVLPLKKVMFILYLISL
jgi:hypothetical protein